MSSLTRIDHRRQRRCREHASTHGWEIFEDFVDWVAPRVTRLKFRDIRVIGVLDGFDSNSAHAGMQADALAAGTLSKA
jgi:hypothetical protein